MHYLFLVPILLISLTLHEVSHGFIAYLLGDDTAYRKGRLTLNPIRHLDPIGLLMFVIFKFGWAKPVPINPYNFDNQKKGMAITAAAGPVVNFIIALLFCFIFKLFINTFGNDILIYLNNNQTALEGHQMIYRLKLILGKAIALTILYNFALGIFNLIPFPPLDGSKILGGFLPDDLYYRYTAQERKGMMIFVIILLASSIFNLNIIGKLILPPMFFVMDIFIDLNWLILLIQQ